MALDQLVVGGGVVLSLMLIAVVTSLLPVRRRRVVLSMKHLPHVPVYRDVYIPGRVAIHRRRRVGT